MIAIIVIISLFILCLALYIIYTLRKIKKFKKSPINWIVKYWIGSEAYDGRVLSNDKNKITIQTDRGEMQFDINDVVPLYPKL